MDNYLDTYINVMSRIEAHRQTNTPEEPVEPGKEEKPKEPEVEEKPVEEPVEPGKEEPIEKHLGVKPKEPKVNVVESPGERMRLVATSHEKSSNDAFHRLQNKPEEFVGFEQVEHWVQVKFATKDGKIETYVFDAKNPRAANKIIDDINQYVERAGIKPQKNTPEQVDDTKKDKSFVRKPVLKLDSKGEIEEVTLSQSLMSRMFYKGERVFYCPKKVYHLYIIRDYEEETTLSMLKGSYFETMVLGSGANDQQVLDLPRKRNNEKTIDQERIDEQIDVFSHVCEKYGIIINKDGPQKNVQIRDKKPILLDGFNGMKVFMSMGYDIISPVSHGTEYPAAIIDLKLTRDRDSEFAPYCWGTPEHMDHIQAFVYSFIGGLPFFYLLFDYRKEDRGHRLIPVNTNINHTNKNKAAEARLRYQDMMTTIRGTLTDIETYNKIGWHTEPTHQNCKTCPILDCEDRNKNQEI